MGQTLRPKQHTWLLQCFHNLGMRPDCRAGLARDVVWCCGCAKAAGTPRARLDPPPAPALPPLHRAGFWVNFRSLSHPTLAQRADGLWISKPQPWQLQSWPRAQPGMSCLWGAFPASAFLPCSCHLRAAKHQDLSRHTVS